jgi:hypothetical protein
MNVIKKISQFVIGLSLVLSSNTFASTFCNQDLSLIALTTSEDKLVFWVGEKVGGECASSRILQIILSNSKAMTLRTYLEGAEPEKFLSKASQAIEGDDAFLEFKQSRLGPIKIGPPSPDNKLKAKYLEKVRDYLSSAGEWNQEMGSNGIQLPQFEGLKTQLEYSYPNGLYVDYKIATAYLYKNEGYLVVFTHQDEFASGYDTMHGFLIFKITALAGNSWKKLWGDSFLKYSHPKKLTAREGFIVKSAPYEHANTLKETSTLGTLKVAGYLRTEYGQFYMSEWSWKHALKGKTPSWIFVK